MTPAERPDVTDEELLARATRDPASHDARAAASELFARHQRRVYLWCFRYVRNHEQAVDLAQDVLVRAYRALGSFGGRSRFSSWLFAIARNRCLSAVAPRALLRDDDADLDDMPHPDPLPEAGLEEEQNLDRVRELLMRHLSVEEGRALWLLCFERMSIDDITRVMGLSNATGARGLLQKARRRLRAALDPGELRSEP